MRVSIAVLWLPKQTYFPKLKSPINCSLDICDFEVRINRHSNLAFNSFSSNMKHFNNPRPDSSPLDGFLLSFFHHQKAANRNVEVLLSDRTHSRSFLCARFFYIFLNWMWSGRGRDKKSESQDLNAARSLVFPSAAIIEKRFRAENGLFLALVCFR